MERRLAAIMAVDVVGYSRLMGQDEAGTLAALRHLRRDVFDPLVGQHHGRVVKLIGDGALVEFSSVVDALACAIAVQEMQQKRETAPSDLPHLVLRIGINLGDVIVEDGDLYGDGVNVAARLEGIAPPGGIAVSQAVIDQARGKVTGGFTDLGEQELKNIAQPVRVYAYGAEGTLAERPVPPADKPSIAVLPFENMSGDPEQVFLCDGISEDIITELSRFSGLLVIARNSSFSYRGKASDLRQVARELGVRYVLEGSIRRAGDRVRITAQLIEGEDGGHVWSERFDRDLAEIFDLQDEISQNVVGAIAPQIELAEIDSVRRRAPVNLTAYETALRAQAKFYEQAGMQRSGTIEASALADQALAIDPRCIHALWIKAHALTNRYIGASEDESETILRDAWTAISDLLRVEQSDARALAARGLIRHLQRDFDAARADFRRAMQLNPNHPWVLLSSAWHLSLTGETTEARDMTHLALRISPKDTDYWVGDAYLTLLQAHFAERDFSQAEAFGLEAVRYGPSAPIRRALVAACQAYLGRISDAKRSLEALEAFAPDFLPRLLAGSITLYRHADQDTLLQEGLRRALNAT